MDLGAARQLGRRPMDAHGLQEWELTFDRAVVRAGLCRHGDRRISLSGPLTALHDEREVTDTVLHEIAHALAGPRAGHGPRWARIATELGATPQRCLDADAPRVPGRWQGTCPRGHTVERHRRPGRVLSCRRCSPRFSPDALFDWTHDGQPATMSPAYLAELARLRAATAARSLLATGGESSEASAVTTSITKTSATRRSPAGTRRTRARLRRS